MHTMILMLAFAGSGVSANVAAPVWQSDYRTAKVQAFESSKPLAVFIGHGKNGWQNVLANTAFDAQTNKLLGEKYVCLYVDTDISSDLAKAFEVPTSGLVISDRSGTIQAFSHTGTLTQQDMTKVLGRYSEMFQMGGTESLRQMGAPIITTSGYTPSEPSVATVTTSGYTTSGSSIGTVTTSGYTPSSSPIGTMTGTPMYYNPAAYRPAGYGSCPNGNCSSGYCPTCPQR